MQTNTKHDIEQAIRRIKTRFDYKNNGRYLSPRGTKREILAWLEAFEEGMDEMELKIKHCRELA